jgi:vitamin B12 transporter
MKTQALKFLLASLPAFPLFAQADESEPLELTPMRVVTPTRGVEPLGQALASVSLISRKDIEIAAAEDVLELLRLQAGVDIVRSGGAGGQTSVFLRGSNSNHVLVLIDGVRAGSANTGAYVWEQLPLNQIERIEIVRGPRGSLYGSDAVGGVIHIITRSSPEPYARLTGGSFGTVAFEGGLGYDGDRTQLSVNAGYRDVDGFSAQNSNGFSYHPDDDGFKTLNLGIKGSTLVDYGEWRYSLLLLDNESEFDEGVSETQQGVATAGFHGSFTPNWDYQVLGGYIDEELGSDFGFFTTGFNSSRIQLSWQNQLSLEENGGLSFGLDHYREQGESTDSWDESRHNTAVFAAWDRHFNHLQLQLAGRYDDNSRFGGKFTGQIALGYEFSDRWRAMASYGSAFRGPNLNEQFSPGFGGLFAGNPDLDPESSTSGEAGLTWRHGSAGSLTASLYRTDVDDLIAFFGEDFQAINIAEARLEGLELEYLLTRSQWSVRANATFQDTENLATGESLLRRPEEKGSLAVDRHFGNGSWLGLEWFYSGARLDFGGVTLDSYHLLNLRAGWEFRPTWRLELRGDNLTDEYYEPAWGFNPAGRSWFVSLAWSP